tara:strand:- start:11092 stop:11475 length:384 start_codon:yes stop_codon:yes gene_type:complete
MSAMRLYLLSLLVLTAAACEPKASTESGPAETQAQAEEPAKPVLATPLARDLDRICNAEEQSGALDEIPSARAQHVGIWLATNLESQDGRSLSVELVQLPPEERIARLKAVLAEQSMSADCEILATW